MILSSPQPAINVPSCLLFAQTTLTPAAGRHIARFITLCDVVSNPRTYKRAQADGATEAGGFQACSTPTLERGSMPQARERVGSATASMGPLHSTGGVPCATGRTRCLILSVLNANAIVVRN